MKRKSSSILLAEDTSSLQSEVWERCFLKILPTSPVVGSAVKTKCLPGTASLSLVARRPDIVLFPEPSIPSRVIRSPFTFEARHEKKIKLSVSNNMILIKTIA
jgi:hypothetical protein